MKQMCSGVGQPAEARYAQVFPFCPICGRELSAQGRKAQQRYANTWASVPKHFIETRI